MPLKQAIPLGLQHVLAMFVGNLTPLLIITGACGITGGNDLAQLQIELLQVKQRREAEIRDHEQHAEHDDHHLADGVVRLTRAVHHHETDDAHDAGADRDHGRVVELEGDIKQQNAHDHRQIRHRGRQRAEEHVAQEFSLDEALVRLHGEDERRDADGNGAHERELRGAERIRQRGKEREKRE